MRQLFPSSLDSPELSADELIALYRPPDRRWLRVNFVTSVDGAIAVNGTSEPLSSPADQQLLRLLRDWADAIIVGAGTVRAENYSPVSLSPPRRAWRLAAGLAEYPPLVIVTQRCELDPDHPALTQAPVPSIVITCENAPHERRVALQRVATVIAVGSKSVDLPEALTLLAHIGLRRPLCEGGPTLLAGLTEADLIDELCLTVAPQLAGSADGGLTGHLALDTPRRLALASVVTSDNNLMLRYSRQPSSD